MAGRGADPNLRVLRDRSLRWQVFQRNLGRAKFWEIYPTTLAGFAAVFLLGRAGEPMRPVLLARRANLPIADIFGIWVLERLFDVASMAVIAAIALIVFRGNDIPEMLRTRLRRRRERRVRFWRWESEERSRFWFIFVCTGQQFWNCG